MSKEPDLRTIGGVMDVLRDLNQDARVYIDNDNPAELMSYRGMYDCLGIATGNPVHPRNRISRSSDPSQLVVLGVDIKSNPTVSDFYYALMLTLGNTFVGYKGGEWLMRAETRIYVSQYGHATGQYLGRLEDIGDRIDFFTEVAEWGW